MPVITLPYSHRDFTTVLAAIKQQLPTVSDGQWTDYVESDPGYTLLKACATLFDFNSFFVDQTGSELFLSTCTLRESGVRLAKQLNYNPTSAQPASVTLQITNPAFTSIVTIPAYSVWLINNQTFVCQSAINIPAGQTTTTVNLVQGSPYSNTITPPGTPWFKVPLPQNAANIVVQVNGVTWIPIDAFVNAPPDIQTLYKVYEDVNFNQVIEFGAGVSAYQLKTTDVLTVNAVLTNGAVANNPQKGLAATLLTVVRNNGGANITSSFSGVTTTAITGGEDVESLASIKQNAPAIYATQGRAITTRDIRSYVLKFPGVTDCRVQGVKEGAPLGNYIVTVYGSNPASVTQEFLDSVAAYLQSLGLLCITPIMQAPVVVVVNSNINVGVLNNTLFTSQSNVINNVNTSTGAFFSSLKISGSLYMSEMSNAIEAPPAPIFATGVPSAGQLNITLQNNFDVSNAELEDALGNVILSGDLSSYVTGNQFLYQNQTLTSQTYTLYYKPAGLTIKYTNITYTVSTSGIGAAGKLIVPLISNYDLSNATLVDALGNTVTSGNLSSYVSNGQFVYLNPSITGQTYTLNYKPSTNNVLVPEGQVCMQGTNTVTVDLVNA